MRTLPALRAARQAATRTSSPSMITFESSGWGGPGLLSSEGLFQPGLLQAPTVTVDLSYWDLHFFLLVPTLWLLTAGRPGMLDEKSDKLTQTASLSYIGFILSIAVAQAFVWDSVGAQIGIWEFNPQKCTGLNGSELPLEEIAWLFHHVVKAALWQLKMSEWSLAAAVDGEPAPLAPGARAAGNALLAAAGVGGLAALTATGADADHLKCVGLVAAFFAPVLAICFNLGTRYLRSHWRLFAAGWLAPGLWTVAIDCVGQQQGVWNFPGQYLTGISTLPDGLLKLDIAAVYMVSTLAVTATGAIILAAGDEFAARRAAAGAAADDATLWDFGLFLFEGALGPDVRRQMERVRPAGVEWSYSDDAASPQPAVVE